MLLHLVTNLGRQRYEITVISFQEVGSSIERALAGASIEVVYLGKSHGFDARMFGRFRNALDRTRPDVVHTHRHVLQYALPSLLGRLRSRTVHTIHNMAEREVTGRPVKFAHWLAIRAGVAPVAICRTAIEGIERLYGVHPRALIPNGIPVASFAAPRVTRSEWRRLNRIPDDAVVFTCVARLSAQKNIGALVRALAAPGGPRKALVMLCGEGEDQPQLEADAERLGVLERVRFMGTRPDIPEALGASDVFVLSSLYEGHPLSVMEAKAAGRPVVATSVGGVPEIVEPGAIGLLVPAGDVDALAVAMERLGRRGALVAAERFDVSHMAKAYDELYQKIVASE